MQLEVALAELDLMETQCITLQKQHSSLTERCKRSEEFVHDLLWKYSLTASRDFENIPPMSTEVLIDSDKRVHNYFIDDVIEEATGVSFRRCHKIVEESLGNSKLDLKGLEIPLKRFALKTLLKESISSLEAMITMEREVRVLTIIGGHANVILLEDVIHTRRHVHIVTETLPSDLFDFIELNHLGSDIGSTLTSVVIRQVLMGVQHLAAKRVAHRDIKPENVLVAINSTTKDIFVKLCNFSYAVILPKTSGDNMVTSFCGSPGFFAPEALLSSRFCAFKADVFSVGAVCLEMLLNKDEFQQKWMHAYDATCTHVTELVEFEVKLHSIFPCSAIAYVIMM